MAIYALIPKLYYPRTLFFPVPASGKSIVKLVQEQQFSYPLIAKPDIGARGMGVRKLHADADLIAYCEETPLDFLVQEYVPYENEVGIFYYRIPGEKTGQITGIVSKEFLAVTGNGRDTIRQLIMKEKRFILQIASLEIMYGEKLKDVLVAGEELVLVPYGNHARGAKFIDVSHLCSPALLQVVDEIAQQIEGFYYGRLDIRYNNWDALCSGKEFSIIELNGAGSEPTHMYDPRHSLFFAWKEIIRHWRILLRISRANHKLGVPYMSFNEGRKMFRDNTLFEKKIAKLYV